MHLHMVLGCNIVRSRRGPQVQHIVEVAVRSEGVRTRADLEESVTVDSAGAKAEESQPAAPEQDLGQWEAGVV
jgi:hypothetical protein